MKVGCTELLKFKKLARRLKLATWQTAGLLEMLWHVTAKNCPRGDIGKMSDEDIGLMIDWIDDPTDLIDTLVEMGWLDRDPEFRLVVHDWSHHAPTYVRGNLVKSGVSFCDDAIAARNSPHSQPRIVPKEYPNECTKDTPKEHPKGGPTKPIQTKPIQTPAPLPPDQGDQKAAADLLISRKVDFTKSAIDAAFAAGATLADVEAIVSHYDSNSGAWTPAALQQRVKSWVRGQPPESGWPKPAKAFEADHADRRKAEREAAERRKAGREAKARRLELERLEREEGPRLNAMTDAELREFVDRLDQSSIVRKQLKERGRNDPGVRNTLLKWLAAGRQLTDSA